MNHTIDDLVLRKVEPRDIDALYIYKNSPEVADMLGGFHPGLSRFGLEEWLRFHDQRNDEVLWAVATAAEDLCIGHVGLYKIDNRVRSAEFAIMIGDRSFWGRGYGSKITRFVLQFGFGYLNLNRIDLSVLENNPRAQALYEKLGFREEGRLRQAQYKGGKYLDVLVMGLLREEFKKL